MEKMKNEKECEMETKTTNTTKITFTTFAIDTITRILDTFHCGIVRNIFNNEINNRWIIICSIDDDMFSAFSGIFLSSYYYVENSKHQ